MTRPTLLKQDSKNKANDSILSEGYQLTRYQCTTLRGIAILFIILHNFIHVFPSSLQELEFCYNHDMALDMFDEFSHPSVGVINQFFSFFGHYGTSIFIFLSGYGLVQKYESGSAKTGIVSFLLHHAMKLWKIIIPGTIIYALASTLVNDPVPYQSAEWYKQLIFLANPTPHSLILPYIYWYIGVAIQLYILYYVVFRNCTSRTLAIGAATQLLIQLALIHFRGDCCYKLCYVNVNFIGWLVVFTAGIHVGRHGVPKLRHVQKLAVCLTLIALFFAGQFVNYLWTLNSFCFCAIFILLTPESRPQMPHESHHKNQTSTPTSHCFHSMITRALHWVGAISMMVYMIHPSVRIIMKKTMDLDINSYSAVLLYVAITLLAAKLISLLYKRLKW